MLFSVRNVVQNSYRVLLLAVNEIIDCFGYSSVHWLYLLNRGWDVGLTFSLTSSETVRDSMRQETAQLMMWNRVYMIRVVVDDCTGGQKAQQSEHGAGPQQQQIWRGGEERGRSASHTNTTTSLTTRKHQRSLLAQPFALRSCVHERNWSLWQFSNWQFLLQLAQNEQREHVILFCGI